jgi:predicted hotdog family 3-hydroxylacyl-ACP dehydratase
MSLLPPIEDLIPHRGTMLMLDRAISFDREAATSEYVPLGNAWYADAQGNMPAWIGIELMAQTIAVHVSLLKRSEGKLPAPGALVGTRRYTATTPVFTANEPLRIEAKVVYNDASGLGAYDCVISSAGQAVANATLKVFEPTDFQAFLQENLS